MGIGNRSRCPAAPWRRRSAHYPSWGLETLGDRQRQRVSVQLITPHGDWKRRCRRPSRSAPTSHYPSWGLETPARRHDGLRRAVLSHYPSWGLETRRTSSRSCGVTGSLPLMGIGNLPSELHPGSRARPHYPSWGLETTGTSSSGGSGSGPHYPSWGLETCAPPARRRRPRLITPHGDWKRPPWPTSTCSWRPHYPSWGLETTGGSPTRCGSASHYPSWGLETPAVGAGVTLHAPLITPHGDWKRHRIAVSQRAGSISLPLMGIGNSVRTRSAGRLPAGLITPHGDWKLHLRREQRDEPPGLITPHGDWKLILTRMNW